MSFDDFSNGIDSSLLFFFLLLVVLFMNSGCFGRSSNS